MKDHENSINFFTVNRIKHVIIVSSSWGSLALLCHACIYYGENNIDGNGR